MSCVYICNYIYIDIGSIKQKEKQADRQIDRQTDRQTDRYADRQSGRQTGSHRQAQAGRLSNRQIDSQRYVGILT